MQNKILEPPTIKVHTGTCSKCGLCTKICPTKVFRTTNGNHKEIKHTEECVLCGQCICGCPTNSIEHSGFVPKFSSTPQTDCDTALQLVQLYAESFGLATCWNGLIQGAASGDHLKGFTRLAEFLRIPGENKCYAAMTIGYPNVSLHSIPERKVDVTLINSHIGLMQNIIN
jgi:NAD-dependent dihydropyrimidine dehydrogenase PreA subunit